MNKQDQHRPPSEVPTQVFERFLRALEESKTASGVVERLRALLLSEKSLTEKAFTEALLSEEQLP